MVLAVRAVGDGPARRKRRRQEVGASRCDLAELDVDAAGGLEDATQTHRLGIERPLDARVARHERTEALAPDSREKFAVTAQDG